MEIAGYELGELLGEGAYGEVRLGRREGQLVAVKRCKDLDLLALRRFFRELLVLRQLRHEHVVRLRDAVMQVTELFLVLELAECDLEHAIRYNLLSSTEQQRVAEHLLAALSYVHGLGLMHRDVKPANVLLEGLQGDLKARLCDFGMVQHSKAKAFSEYVGMRWYRAPEVLLGHTYGCGADVWSYGCVVAEMALGRPLLAGIDQEESARFMRNALFRSSWGSLQAVWASPESMRPHPRWCTMD